LDILFQKKLEEDVNGKNLENIQKDYVVVLKQKRCHSKSGRCKIVSRKCHWSSKKKLEIFQKNLVFLKVMQINHQEEKDVVFGEIIVLENNVDLLVKNVNGLVSFIKKL